MKTSQFILKYRIHILTICALLFGWYIASNYQLTPKNTDIEITQKTETQSDSTSAEIVFDADTSSIVPLLLAPTLKTSFNNGSLHTLECMRGIPHGTRYTGAYIQEKIQNNPSYEHLKKPIKEIIEHKYEFHQKILDTNGEVIQNEVLYRRAYVDIFSVCRYEGEYIVFFRTIFNWEDDHRQTQSFIPSAYAGGGPPASHTYLAVINISGEVTYHNLIGLNSENNTYDIISTESIKKYGYTYKRHTDYLYPVQIVGQFNDKILLQFRTACYECKDNPLEESLYLISLNPFRATELSFCENANICYDRTGKYLDLLY